jgi:FkbM family methyltransferase
MYMIALALIAVLASAVSLAAAAVLWRKLSAAHARIHRLERSELEAEHQLTSLSRAASRAEARARLPAVAASTDCHAQHGEEFFIWELLGFKAQGTFIEIGAYDGVSLSNSLFFERLGWKGVLVEAHPELARRCRENRPGATVVHAALGPVDGGSVRFSMVRGDTGLDTLSFVSTTEQHRNRIRARGGDIEQVEVPSRTLRSVVAEIGLGDVDWMSVDVEGSEIAVLEGSGLDSFRPKVVVVEDNSRGRDAEIGKFLAGYGYRRVKTVGCNDIYRHDA